MRVSETLDYSDYRNMRRRPSYFDKDKQVYEEISMFCPQCRSPLPSLAHAQRQQCGECGLVMQRFGNVLKCVGEVNDARH